MKEDRVNLSAQEETLLTVLLHSPALYGLEIKKAVADATNGRRRIGFGSLYPALHELEKKGWVKSHWGDERPAERGGARRKYYKITGLGERALQEAQAIRTSLAQWKPALARN